jgi:N-acyl homoserine lactone hydrolase
MLKHTGTALLSFLAAASLLLDVTPTKAADSSLPDATRAGFAERLYRLDCGHSLANERVGLDAWRKCRTEHRILIY